LDWFDESFWKWMSKEAQVFFQSPDHDPFQLFGIDIDSTRKALWVQDLQ